MATPKLSESPRIACYGTEFLVAPPIDAKSLMGKIASDVPQFSSPRLDASFLINCGRLHAGRLHAGEVVAVESPSTYVKRVAGTDFRSPKTTVLYECSTELCDLLAALTDERAAETATQWHGVNLPMKPNGTELNGRTQRRLAILKNLAALAKQANDGNKTLMLRVEYRNHSY
jgi:hypothetical protein